MSQLFARVAATHRGYDPEQVDAFFDRARRAYEGGVDGVTPAAPDPADAAPASTASTDSDDDTSATHVRVPGARETRATPSGTDSFDAHAVRTAAFDLVRRGYRASSVDAALDRLEAAFVATERADFIAEHGQAAWMNRVVERATTLYERLTRPVGARFAPPERGRGYAAVQVDELLDRLIAYFDEGQPLTAAEVRGTVFTAAPASRAYAEGPVDAYLDRVVDVLLAVE